MDYRPLYANRDGTCVLATDLAPVTVLSAADRDELFVKSKLEVVESSVRMSVQRLVTDDGAEQTLSMYDGMLDTACTRRPLETVAGIRSFCTPITVAFRSGFSDSSCTKRLVYVNVGYGLGAPLIELGERSANGSCGYKPLVVGAAYTEPTLYDQRMDTCSATKVADAPYIQSLWDGTDKLFDTTFDRFIARRERQSRGDALQLACRIGCAPGIATLGTLVHAGLPKTVRVGSGFCRESYFPWNGTVLCRAGRDERHPGRTTQRGLCRRLR